MSYRDNCGICGESYNDENLLTCKNCSTSFCYHCGDCRKSLCQRCIDSLLIDKSKDESLEKFIDAE